MTLVLIVASALGSLTSCGSGRPRVVEKLAPTHPPVAAPAPTPEPKPTMQPTPSPAPRSKPKVVASAPAGAGSVRSVSSTAYCETGGMYSGKRTYSGAVAVTGAALASDMPLGSRWAVLSGPASGRVLTVEDKIGHGSEFDIAMPGDCAGARVYGRRQIRIAKAA
jgi:hypothetical protein